MATSLIVESPIGPLHLVAEDGALVGLYMEGQPVVAPRSPPFDSAPSALRSGPADGLALSPSGETTPFALRGGPEGRSRSADPASTPDPVLVQAAEQLAAWFEGELRTFDLPLRPRGTPFQRSVWRELQRIPYGHTRTYGAISAALGTPTASRAVGAANGRNPISIIVPCHRVIGATGALTGYAGGLARKRWLLDHERAVLAR